ncbi:MAG: phosphodiester glycosidase family protein [Synergistaceae bacterium]|nr:phosphodiester glycosidase family protein [Synergistaceae bacterium]
MKKLKHLCLIVILFLTASQAEAVTKYAFLSGLLDARGIDWSSSPEAEFDDPGGFMLRTGYVTDDVDKLDSPVTRIEALRWCIESLGLAFEAELLSDYPSGFRDAGKLSDFERGCLVVATNMNPPLFAKADTFNPSNALTNKEYDAVLSRVIQAGRSLTLNMIRNPLNGIRVYIHREGVPTGIPSWRVYAYGMNRETANNVKNLLKSQGIESGLTGSGNNSGVRTAKLEDFSVARRFIAFLNFRKIKYRLIPSMTNPKTRIVPRFWVMVTVDPSYWKILPVASRNGPTQLSPLSQIARQNNTGAVINAGFFAAQKGGKGYPIGALKVGGRDFGTLYEGRGGLGWDDNDEAVFGIPTEEDYSVYEMSNVIQAGPMLIDNGIPARTEEDFTSAFTAARHPRSAVGVNSAGQWVFMIVDGRNGMHSSGATISELTEILRAQNVTHALNLDGGGSTELIVDGRIYNMPSDGYERSISYGLGAIAR